MSHTDNLPWIALPEIPNEVLVGNTRPCTLDSARFPLVYVSYYIMQPAASKWYRYELFFFLVRTRYVPGTYQAHIRKLVSTFSVISYQYNVHSCRYNMYGCLPAHVWHQTTSFYLSFVHSFGLPLCRYVRTAPTYARHQYIHAYIRTHTTATYEYVLNPRGEIWEVWTRHQSRPVI